MRDRMFFFLVLIACLSHVSWRCRAGKIPYILVETDAGDIVIEVYAKRSPVTAVNFLRYVDEGRYKEAKFYRVVRVDNQPRNEIKIEVVQGGIGFVESELRLPPIVHETTEQTGILHLDGVVSMARAEPGTASSEFFICINDQPELDYGGRRNPDGQGFAAFGRVVHGMDVVRKIQTEEADGQMLRTPVRISSIRRVIRASK
ncbi:MAG: peptidylprolyl isomerase [candidate division WOR-3 bacterium]|nr:MAG: peptidylprolyl isomerase [candidate division WOR-3 bacterium]